MKIRLLKMLITLVSTFGKIDGLVNNAANNPKVENSDGKNFSRLENFPLEFGSKIFQLD